MADIDARVERLADKFLEQISTAYFETDVPRVACFDAGEDGRGSGSGVRLGGNFYYKTRRFRRNFSKISEQNVCYQISLLQRLERSRNIYL